MKQSINLYQFREAFRLADRSGNFSYEGLEVLFDYLEQLEEDTGEEMELDVIALCCNFTEEYPDEISGNYEIELTGDDESDYEIVIEYLQDNTMVVGHKNGLIVYQQF